MISLASKQFSERMCERCNKEKVFLDYVWLGKHNPKGLCFKCSDEWAKIFFSNKLYNHKELGRKLFVEFMKKTKEVVIFT